MSRRRLPQGQEDGQPQDICLQGNTFLPVWLQPSTPDPQGPGLQGVGTRAGMTAPS